MRTEPDGVGSSDLQATLQDLGSRLEKLTDRDVERTLKRNKDLALRRSLLLLYARFVCLRVFLTHAAAKPGGITENHKLRWLLIQVAPATLLPEDIFMTFIRLVRGASAEYLSRAIQVEANTIDNLLPQTPLFCVLDEAQVLTSDVDYFRSNNDPETPRPILREIISSLTGILPKLIVSGTGISMAAVEIIVGSLVAKEGDSSETVTEIGAFDDEDTRRAYLEQYFPLGFLDTPEGKEIASQVGFWLRGRFVFNAAVSQAANQIRRHRFLATYLSRLIGSGFQSPSRVLSDFVFGMTGFRPSNLGEGTASPINLKPPRGFDFHSLSKSEHSIEFSGVILNSIAEKALRRDLADFAFEYTFTGRIRGLGGPTGDAMVEYGVSRFKTRVAQTDEPLAILALLTYFEEKQSLETYLIRALNTSNAAHRGIAFEAFGAYILALKFSEPRRLSEVFEFEEGGKKVNPALKDEIGQLVTLEKVGNKFEVTPLAIKSKHRSCHLLGYSPSTAADTLEWLQDPEGTAFCFPANDVGPDLIFVLKLLKSNTVLRVCVQFKHTQELSAKESEKAIRTTDPSFFLSEKRTGNNSLTCSNPAMRDKIEEAIKKLGNGTKNAGRCGVLQVLISHPSLPDSKKLEEAARGSHPVATVALNLLGLSKSDLGESIIMLGKSAVGKPERKRKCEVEEKFEGRSLRSKKQRKK